MINTVTVAADAVIQWGVWCVWTLVSVESVLVFVVRGGCVCVCVVVVILCVLLCYSASQTPRSLSDWVCVLDEVCKNCAAVFICGCGVYSALYEFIQENGGSVTPTATGCQSCSGHDAEPHLKEQSGLKIIKTNTRFPSAPSAESVFGVCDVWFCTFSQQLK